MKEVLDYDLDSAVRGRNVPDELEAAHLEQYQEAKREIVRAVNLGAYLMGHNARTRLQAYLSELKQGHSIDSWAESLVLSATATNTCLEEMIEIARRDLRR